MAGTRFLLLPQGPWEQDEALLACGVVDFDPAGHMPHPPGFPLWIWIGRLLLPFGGGDPLRALQVASAGFSVLAFFALVWFWQRWVPRNLATAGALLASFLPGAWFHASRAFSETPAAALFLLALLAWQRGGERRLFWASLALSAAGLVRPPLLPFFALVWLFWAWQFRRNPREVGQVLAVVAGFGAAVMVPLVLEAGGIELFWEALTTHAGEHAFLLGSEGFALGQLGLVKGLGGPVPALAMLLSALAGWVAQRRTVGPRSWLVASLLGFWLVYLLAFTHNSTYPRYWVMALLLLPVPGLYGLQLLFRKTELAVGAGFLAAAYFAWWTWPAVRCIHQTPLPPVAAFGVLPADPQGNVVFQDELFSFRNYLLRVGKLAAGSLRWSEVQPPKFNLGGAKLFLVAETAPTYLPSSVSRERFFQVGEPRAAYLSQGRFLQAFLVENPVLLASGGSIREAEEAGPFVWLYPRATLLLPATAGAGHLSLAVQLPPDVPGAPVAAKVDGVQVAVVQLAPGPQLLSLPLPELPQRQREAKVVPLELVTGCLRKLPGDLRPLALKVRYVSLEAPPWEPLPYLVLPEPTRLHAKALEASGLYGPESFAGVPGAWCQPKCSFALPVSAGRVQLWLSAPRPGGARVALRLGETTLETPVPPTGTYLELPVPSSVTHATRLELVLEAPAFNPPNDPRSLGVVVHGVGFQPTLPPLRLDRRPPVPFPLTRRSKPPWARSSPKARTPPLPAPARSS